MNLAGVTVGPDQPCRFVAEIGNAHNGSLDRALRLLDAAKACGADLAKLQVYTADELIALRGDGPPPPAWAAQGYTMRSLYEKAATPFAWLPALFARARALGLPLFSSVFGAEGLAALEAMGCPAYKSAALDHAYTFRRGGDAEIDPEKMALHERARATGKPIIQSVRGWDYRPSRRWPWQRPYADLWLYCPPGYPQFYDLAHRDLDTHEIARFDGLSFHGTDVRVPVRAAAVSHVVECHFMLDAEPSELEANVSLGEDDFRFMVETVRYHERLAA